MAKTHIAGLGLVIGDRFARQRCAWCGEVMVDEDATCIAVPEGSSPRDPLWPVNTLVRFEVAPGVTSYTVVTADVLPDDCCARIDTRQAPQLRLVDPSPLETELPATLPR